MDTETHPVGGFKAPATSRYWNARQQIRASDLMERQLSFFEVLQTGKRLYNRWNSISLYGMTPLEWYSRGIRILGRTAIEAHHDKSAAKIGRRLAKLNIATVDVIDPFIGSGNLAYHVAAHLRPARIVGCEINARISSLTRNALQLLRTRRKLKADDIVVINDDWTKAIAHTRDVPTLIILSPPWGDAYKGDGLDLRETDPPIPELLTAFLNVPASHLHFLIPIAGGKTHISPIIADPRLELVTHDPRKGCGFLLLKRRARQSPNSRRSNS